MKYRAFELPMTSEKGIWRLLVFRGEGLQRCALGDPSMSMIETMVETELKSLPERAKPILKKALGNHDELQVINGLRMARMFEDGLRKIAEGNLSQEVFNPRRLRTLRDRGLITDAYLGWGGQRNILTPLGAYILRILEAERKCL